MSMIENFLNAKELLKDDLDEIREEALKAAEHKADERIDKFIDGYKAMIADASDAEFIEFITSGKLEDDDILAAINFRHEAAKICSEPCKQPNESNEKSGHHIRMIVLGDI